MVTYIFHRLQIGKVEIDNIFCLNGDIWEIFLQKCLLFQMTFVQIADFDLLPRRKNGKFSKENVKKSSQKS